MHKGRWYAALLAGLATLALVLLPWSFSTPPVQVEQLTLADGSPAMLASPAEAVSQRVLLIVPQAQWLAASALQTLAQRSDARLIQLEPSDNCQVANQRLQAASQQLLGAPTLVAGIGPGAASAWRWLSAQQDDGARALSIGFSLSQPDCPQPLPARAQHGQWIVAWNDNPDDASARFVRGQGNAEAVIGAYELSLGQLLQQQLDKRLAPPGEDHSAMAVVEVPAAQQNSTVTLFYSGDGGWRDLDREVATHMAERGYGVVGIDSLRYFWEHKSPEQGAEDLSRLMRQYRNKWSAQRFVLAGYSFGADVLPAFYNRLPAEDQQQIDALLLLGLARDVSFEIKVQGWLGTQSGETPLTSELLKLPPRKVLCVYGLDEAARSGCTLPQAPGESLGLPGDHHYNQDYPALTRRLLHGIEQRQQGASAAAQ